MTKSTITSFTDGHHFTSFTVSRLWKVRPETSMAGDDTSLLPLSGAKGDSRQQLMASIANAALQKEVNDTALCNKNARTVMRKFTFL
jgi:hypothetical protein